MEPTDLMVRVAEGVRLHVRHWPATGIPFLLVHGLASNARLWDGVATRLRAAGYPAYAVDLRSHGTSDRTPTGHDTATAAADLAALCAAPDLTRVLRARQSWGGNAVASFAAQHPQPVAAVALVDGGWIDLPAQFSSWAECESALRPPELGGAAVSTVRGYLRRNHPDWADWAIEVTM